MPLTTPTLVFLHYSGGAAASWSSVISLLEPDYACIALDLPGFGNQEPLSQPSFASFSRFVWSRIHDLNLQQFILVGHDMGGKIALQVASDDHCGLITQLILVAPSPSDQQEVGAAEKRKMLVHPDLEEVNRLVKKSRILPLDNEAFSLAVSTQMMTDTKTWHWWILEGMSQSISARVAELSVPITILASADDPVVSYSSLKNEQRQVLRQAELIATTGIGHLIPLEAPDWLALQIRSCVPRPAMKIP